MKTIYQVDAFTNEAFSGNPACVFIADEHTPVEWMQSVANEMNVSETAFVFPMKTGLTIRWFTPVAEVNLCGHATLSASHILFETGFVKPDEMIVFNSKSGELRITKNGSWITMDFPAYPLIPIDIPSDFEKITGVKPLEIYNSNDNWAVVLLEDENQVRNANPDFGAMRKEGMRDLILTAPSSEDGFDFCTRCFVPSVGIDEDPVTGSAHCALTPFWHKKTGKTEFMSRQVSKRGGILKLTLRGDRVFIAGQAVTVLRGDIMM